MCTDIHYLSCSKSQVMMFYLARNVTSVDVSLFGDCFTVHIK